MIGSSNAAAAAAAAAVIQIPIIPAFSIHCESDLSLNDVQVYFEYKLILNKVDVLSSWFPVLTLEPTCVIKEF